MSDRPTPAMLAHPDREAALALPALEDLFRAVARQVRTRLVNRAGADIPVRLGVAQVTTVGHILEDSETRDGGVFSVFSFDPLGLPGLVVVQGRLLARIVGVMLGESPTEEAPPYRIRQVTDVELRIAKRACEDVMNGLIEAWPASKPMKITVDSIGTNPRAASGLAETTPVVAASLDFGRPDDPYGLMIVAIPAQTTRDLRVPTLRTLKRAPRGSHVDLKSCMPLEVDLVAELAAIQLSFSEMPQTGQHSSTRTPWPIEDSEGTTGNTGSSLDKGKPTLGTTILRLGGEQEGRAHSPPTRPYGLRTREPNSPRGALACTPEHGGAQLTPEIGTGVSSQRQAHWNIVA